MDVLLVIAEKCVSKTCTLSIDLPWSIESRTNFSSVNLSGSRVTSNL